MKLNHEEENKLNSLISNYKNNITEYGLLPNVLHQINIKQDIIVSCKPYMIPNNLYNQFQEEINRLLNLGFIEKSYSAF